MKTQINHYLLILKDIEYNNLTQVYNLFGSGNYVILSTSLSAFRYTESLLVNSYRNASDIRDIIISICEIGTKVFITSLCGSQAWDMHNSDFDDRIYKFLMSNDII